MRKGIRIASGISTADKISLDLLCGDDNLYSPIISEVLQRITKFLISDLGSLPPAIIIGHHNYGQDFSMRHHLKSLMGKLPCVSPSGIVPMDAVSLASLGAKVATFKDGSLWKIDQQASAMRLIVKNDLPRYIGLAYRSDFLASFMLSQSSSFFCNTMHLYAAPLVLPLFNQKLPSLYYFLPTRPLLHYYVGIKRWDPKAVWHALGTFFDALVKASSSNAAPLFTKK